MTDFWWVPFELVGLGILIVLVSLPMLFKKVGRNSVYGFRSRLTLSSDKIWYAANAYAAKHFIIAALFLIGPGIAGFFMETVSGKAALALHVPGVVALCNTFVRCYLWRPAK